MAYEVNYDDLDYGDETRGEAVQTVGLPHDEATDGLVEGQAVGFNGTKIVAADASNPAIGVLYTYQYYGDSSGSGPQVRQDRNATVAVGGKIKAQVEGDVTAGSALTTPDTGGTETAGNFGVDNADDSSNFTALTDAKQQDNDNPNGGTGESYAEVLIR